MDKCASGDVKRIQRNIHWYFCVYVRLFLGRTILSSVCVCVFGLINLSAVCVNHKAPNS